MTALVARKTQEADSLTVAVATAGSILLSADALAKWQASHGDTSARRGPMDAQTLSLMVAQFPGSFKVN